jgi:hypothetical protein
MVSLTKGWLVTFLFGSVALCATRIRIVHRDQCPFIIVVFVVTTAAFQGIHVDVVGKGYGRPLQLAEDVLMGQFVAILLCQRPAP